MNSAIASRPFQFGAPSHPWNSLPPEIRLYILQLIAASDAGDNTEVAQGHNHHSLAPFASVCREWQTFFERITFKRLVMDQSDLPTFAKAVKGSNVARLSYIRQLWLRIKLSKYTCRSCAKPEDGLAITRNNRIFTKSITRLLATLSSWQAQDGGGLALEISAHSPSDLEHRFNQFQIADDYPFLYESDLAKRPGLLEYHRQKLSTVTSSHPRTHRTMDYHRRVFGTPLELRPWRLKDKRGRPNPVPTLKKAPIVKGLLLRRHFYRGMAVSTLVALFQQSLTAVNWFQFERWQYCKKKEEEVFHKGFETQLLPAFPPSLKSFYFEQGLRKGFPEGRLLSRNAEESLVEAAVESCSRLTELSVPWPIEARKFLHYLTLESISPISKSRVFRRANIESLCIRCTWLDPIYTQDHVTHVLELAGRAARFMPKLRILEIWNIKDSSCYLFKYTVDHYNAKITWRCFGRQFSLAPSVIKVWAEAASERTHRPLSVDVEPFPYPAHVALLSKCVFLYRNLALRRMVFDPVTLEQLEANTILSHR